MVENDNNGSENSQEQQEWENIDNRQYFESINENAKITEQGKVEYNAHENHYKEEGRTSGATAISGSLKVFLALSWISAAFTGFVSPYFAVSGIVFGVLANKIVRRSGNAAIITNVVLAIINLIFSFFLMASLGRTFR